MVATHLCAHPGHGQVGDFHREDVPFVSCKGISRDWVFFPVLGSGMVFGCVAGMISVVFTGRNCALD